MFSDFISFVRDLYSTESYIPLHAPQFNGNEKKYIESTIDSTFVSSVGEFVNKFEQLVQEFTGIKYAIATVNGTAAMHIALKLSGVERETEVITQSLTFVATCNAIRYCGAIPVLIDVEKSTLGMSPQNLQDFLDEYCEVREDGFCWNHSSNRRISACLPMHTFGHPVQIEEIERICSLFNINLIEDAAESLGSFYKGRHTGSFGKISAVSFNGNKIITSGGGGMILTNDDELAHKAKHITTTAKIPSLLSFDHDQVGYNYRMPNLNAALGVAQMESLSEYLKSKRDIAIKYQNWGRDNEVIFISEHADCSSNYWLNCVVTENEKNRDLMLKVTNESNIMTRPIWKPMHKLPMYQNCQKTDLSNTEWLYSRIVNVPSSPIIIN